MFSGSTDERIVEKATDLSSRENASGVAANGSGRNVSWRCAFASDEPIHIWPRRTKAICFLSLDRMKFPPSVRSETRTGFGEDGDTVHSSPSLPNRIWSGETHARRLISDNSMSASTGKSVSATGFSPGVTTNKSCLPAASHRNATRLPSGDQVALVGYL